MEEQATSRLAALNVENPASEFEDFEALVQRYRPRLLRFLFASVGDLDVAETLLQDCFMNAYRSRRAFRGDCSVNTWLTRIAVNLVRNHVRSGRFQFWKSAVQPSSDDDREWLDKAVSPEDRTVLKEEVRQVWEATKSLSRRQQTVFLLRFVEDMEIPEISQATGIPEGAVHVHLFRAVRNIRKRLRKIE